MRDGMHGCNVPRIEPEDRGGEATRAAVRLVIAGMGCVNCANRIHNALITMPGVGAAEIDHRTGQGTVYFDPERVSQDRIVAQVAVAGGTSGHRYQAAVASSLARFAAG